MLFSILIALTNQNRQFHALQLLVSSFGTVCSTARNSLFHALKLKVYLLKLLVLLLKPAVLPLKPAV